MIPDKFIIPIGYKVYLREAINSCKIDIEKFKIRIRASKNQEDCRNGIERLERKIEDIEDIL